LFALAIATVTSQNSSLTYNYYYTVVYSYISLDEAKKQVFYELKYPSFIKRKRLGESKRSILARRSRVVAKEMKQQGDKKNLPLRAKVTVSTPPNTSSYIGRFLLGNGPKYMPVRHEFGSQLRLKSKEPLHSTPRSHNYRRKALITVSNKKNCAKNKSSSLQPFKSNIYNFSILFSNSPVSFGMSIHALAAPSKIFASHKKRKKKKKSTTQADIARMAKRRVLIERVLIKTLYKKEECTYASNLFLLSLLIICEYVISQTLFNSTRPLCLSSRFYLSMQSDAWRR